MSQPSGITRNAVVCASCGSYLLSLSEDQDVTCRCEAISLAGGTKELRLTGYNRPFHDLSRVWRQPPPDRENIFALIHLRLGLCREVNEADERYDVAAQQLRAVRALHRVGDASADELAAHVRAHDKAARELQIACDHYYWQLAKREGLERPR